MKFIDLTGQRFGKLIVIKCIGQNKWGYYIYLCKCDCGNEKIISGQNLRNGQTKSCGCFQKEITLKANLKHGHTSNGKRSKIYRVWDCIIQRCNNSNNSRYKDYGGRGIKVCWRWSNKNPKGFENFYKDVGDPPKGKSFDRTNNNGDYKPGNWKWSTPKEQANNRRNNKNKI